MVKVPRISLLVPLHYTHLLLPFRIGQEQMLLRHRQSQNASSASKSYARSRPVSVTEHFGLLAGLFSEISTLPISLP